MQTGRCTLKVPTSLWCMGPTSVMQSRGFGSWWLSKAAQFLGTSAIQLHRASGNYTKSHLLVKCIYPSCYFIKLLC